MFVQDILSMHLPGLQLKAFHDRVARLPPIAKFYERFTEGPRLSYKPLSS